MMKREFFLRQFICFWFVTLVLLIITGCASLVDSQEQVKVIATRSTITPSVTMTAVYQPTTTIPSVPTEPKVLPSPATSPTGLSSPALTPIPALSAEMIDAREQLIQELMQTNGNCQLPCWWGIELRQNIETAGQRFTDLRMSGWNVMTSDLSDNDNAMGYIHLGYYDLENSFFCVRISLKLYTVGEKIQFIRVFTERPLRKYGEEEFVRDWDQYFLSAMLQKYGKPTHVYLVPLNIAEPSPPDHALILYYPELGINVSYDFHGNWIEDGMAEVCPNITNAKNIELSLYNPEFADVWGTYLSPPEFYTDPELIGLFNAWTWAVQTGTDIDTFYETYRISENLECVQVSQ